LPGTSQPASTPAPAGPAPGGPAVPIARKIIYNANIDIIVEDFARAEQGFRQLMRAQKDGYIADEQITGASGSQRQGKWTVRIPVGDFEAFLQDVGKLGVVQDSRRNSREVTEQFYDLEGRIKIKKAEEERIVKLLADNTGKLEDIISVERELTRVRGEIEQLVGSLRLLENLTALTTVTLTITERKNYVPPQTPTFAAMIARTFSDSVERLVDVGKTVVLIVVAIAPWLPLSALLVLLAYLFVRFLVRIVARAAAPIAPRVPPGPAGP
jgi:hypothetical protein